MTPDRVALLDRITAFDIDGPDAPALPFAARLSREHGWSRPYAERVIGEYKRYVFLAATSDEPVCPSEDVDAAWHLHLTYTRSYWKRFCGEVLGRQLHHDPTKGGPAEASKHLRMYAATLAAYRDTFGHEPPADVWPPAGTRFGHDLQHRVVNTARNWVIPKRPVVRVAQLTAALVAAAVFVPGCAGGQLDPFSLKGQSFLVFLVAVLLAAVVAGRVVRSVMRKPDPQPGGDEPDLTWEEAAFLTGGYLRLASAAIARLAEHGALYVEKDTLRAGSSGPPAPTAVESVILSSLPITKTGMKPVHDAVEAAFAAEAARLEADGFVLPVGRQVGIACAAVAPLVLTLAFLALPRFVMGLANHKPVEDLAVVSIIGAIFGTIAVLAGSLRRSRRGEAALDGLRSKHAGLQSGAVTDAALGVALFGTAVLAGSTVPFLQAWYPRETNGNSSGGCGSGCGSDGGGGCGGCGGGD